MNAQQEYETLLKRFADQIEHLDDEDTVTISKKDLRQAITEIMEIVKKSVEKNQLIFNESLRENPFYTKSGGSPVDWNETLTNYLTL